LGAHLASGGGGKASHLHVWKKGLERQMGGVAYKGDRVTEMTEEESGKELGAAGSCEACARGKRSGGVTQTQHEMGSDPETNPKRSCQGVGGGGGKIRDS